MNSKLIAISAVVLSLAACGPAVSQQTPPPNEQGQTMPGPYMMGRGYGPGMMMGPGGMGYGMGPYMMGRGYMMGPGMMGQGMMMGPGMGYGMGPYMMGRGMGYGPGYGMGPGFRGPEMAPLNLTVKEVTDNLDRWLAIRGNPNLKVGKVKEKDKNTITAEIVTKDNSLVRRYEIDRSTGFMRPVG